MPYKNTMKKANEVLIVEVDKLDVPSQEEAREGDEALASLNGHPGFEELLRRFRFARAGLRSKLETTSHETLYTVYELQQGIKWLGLAERIAKQAVGRREQVKARPPYAEEVEEFERISKFITVVGKGQVS